MKEIQLTQGMIALIDDEDFERVNQFNWCAKKHRNTFYAIRFKIINGKNSNETLHYFIMQIKGVDHINGNGIDCQKSNMRECTNQQNTMNSRPRKNSTSKFKGVSWHNRDNKWCSQIMKDGKNYYLGQYDNEIEAAIVYDKKAKELFGEFAYLNFPSQFDKWIEQTNKTIK